MINCVLMNVYAYSRKVLPNRERGKARRFPVEIDEHPPPQSSWCFYSNFQPMISWCPHPHPPHLSTNQPHTATGDTSPPVIASRTTGTARTPSQTHTFLSTFPSVKNGVFVRKDGVFVAIARRVFIVYSSQ